MGVPRTAARSRLAARAALSREARLARLTWLTRRARIALRPLLAHRTDGARIALAARRAVRTPRTRRARIAFRPLGTDRTRGARIALAARRAVRTPRTRRAGRTRTSLRAGLGVRNLGFGGAFVGRIQRDVARRLLVRQRHTVTLHAEARPDQQQNKNDDDDRPYRRDDTGRQRASALIRAEVVLVAGNPVGTNGRGTAAEPAIHQSRTVYPRAQGVGQMWLFLPVDFSACFEGVHVDRRAVPVEGHVANGLPGSVGAMDQGAALGHSGDQQASRRQPDGAGDALG